MIQYIPKWGKNMQKLLFFDIDGTLTNEETGIIPEKTKEALKKAKANGHKCFLNSGRTLAIIDKQFIDLVDGVVAGLGTCILLNNEIIMYREANQALCKSIMELALKCNVECYFEDKDSMYTLPNYRFEMFRDIKEDHLNRKYVVKEYPCEDITFDKFCMMEDENGDYETFDAFVGNYFRKIDRGNSFFEYEALGYSKASGIDYLCEYFHTTLDNCYAFGDSTNDLPMLKHVPHSILMGNGTQSLREYVEYVTTSSATDGIENALKHYGLI